MLILPENDRRVSSKIWIFASRPPLVLNGDTLPATGRDISPALLVSYRGFDPALRDVMADMVSN